MTKKDYEKFASLIAGEKALVGQWPMGDKRTVIENFKLSIADIFAHDSPRFDRERFYEACEPKE